MRIAVVGRGSVGSALGGSFTNAGHDVVYGVRSPGAADERPLDGIATDAEVVVLAVPHGAVFEVVDRLGGLDGRLVLDCTNPITWGPDGPTVADGPSIAHRLRERFPGAAVFKAFNSTGAEVMRNPVVDGRAAAMPFAGDGPARRADVAQLIVDAGFEPLDAGGLGRAPLLEQMAVLWIGLVMGGALTRTDAFAVLRP